MRIQRTSLFCLAVILQFIELSSQSKHTPDDGPDPGTHRRRPSTSSAPSRHVTNTTHSVTSSASSASTSSRFRERSRSPTLRQTYPSVLGFSFEDLASIRLVPHDHPNRVFDLRIFRFPPEKQIGLQSRKRDLKPISNGDQIVVSTSSGDICAILEKSKSRATNIRAIYTSVSGRLVRVKMNINTGAIEKLSMDENLECPPTAHGEIVKSYGVLQSQNTTSSLANPLHPATSSTPAEPELGEASNSSPPRESFTRICGYSVEDLPLIRLAPLTHPNRIFELRRYIFSPDKPLRLRTKIRILIPMPTEQQIVLSTPDGDICAILEKGVKRPSIIRAMFTPIFGMAERAKINMNSGVVEEMTEEEMAECPVSSRGPITYFYRVFRVPG